MRLIKVGVIEQVEELESDTELATLPMRNLRHLHNTKVSIEEVRPDKGVSA